MYRQKKNKFRQRKMKLAQLITGVIGTSEWQESFAEYRPKYFGESVEASVGTITPEQCCNSLQVWIYR